MIVYTVQEPGKPAQNIEERADSVVFIREGFTWWGFLFWPIWLLYNWLWLEFIVAWLLAAGVTVLLVQLGLRDQAPGLVYLLFMFFIGFEGNDLRRWRLQRKGYVYVASVAGRDSEECERRFFDAWLPHIAGRGGGTGLASAATDPRPSSGGDWRGTGVIGTLPGTMA